jgi:hypothetical protein
VPGFVGPGFDAPLPPPPQLTRAITLKQRTTSRIASRVGFLRSHAPIANRQPNPTKSAAAKRVSNLGFKNALKFRASGNPALAAVVETVTWKGTGELLNTATSDGARKQLIRTV